MKNKNIKEDNKKPKEDNLAINFTDSGTKVRDSRSGINYIPNRKGK
ncbi:hypothetical protein [uncultured Polaribacter sp.]|nr:hypothetical protein [uncultured Polaribacter sp.]